MAYKSKSENDGSDKEILLALEATSRNNPNKKVADEKQLMMVDITDAKVDNADAKVTDDDDVSEFQSLGGGDSEASYYFDAPGKRLGDAEVSNRDVLKKQLNAADATAAPEMEHFSKVDKILRHMVFSLSKSVYQFQLDSMDYAYLAYRWCAVPVSLTYMSQWILFVFILSELTFCFTLCSCNYSEFFKLLYIYLWCLNAT